MLQASACQCAKSELSMCTQQLLHIKAFFKTLLVPRTYCHKQAQNIHLASRVPFYTYTLLSSCHQSRMLMPKKTMQPRIAFILLFCYLNKYQRTYNPTYFTVYPQQTDMLKAFSERPKFTSLKQSKKTSTHKIPSTSVREKVYNEKYSFIFMDVIFPFLFLPAVGSASIAISL